MSIFASCKVQLQGPKHWLLLTLKPALGGFPRFIMTARTSGEQRAREVAWIQKMGRDGVGYWGTYVIGQNSLTGRDDWGFGGDADSIWVYLPKVSELQFLNSGMRTAPGTQDEEAYFSKLASLYFVKKGSNGFEPSFGVIGQGASWASVNAILPAGGVPITWTDS